MAEIAFTVMPRAYEEWTFYSDSDDVTKSKSTFKTKVNWEEFVLGPSHGETSKQSQPPNMCLYD